MLVFLSELKCDLFQERKALMWPFRSPLYKLGHTALYLVKKVKKQTTVGWKHFQIQSEVFVLFSSFSFQNFQRLIFAQVFKTKKIGDKEEERAGSDKKKAGKLSSEDDEERWAWI